MGTRENNFKVQFNCAADTENFFISDISPVLSNVSYEVVLTFGFVRNDFFKGYLKQSQRSLRNDVNNLGTKFLSLLVDSFLILFTYD